MNDSYAILGIKPGADKSVIQKAYRTLAKSAHPDHSGGNVGQFHQIRQAYEALTQTGRAPQPRKPQPNRALFFGLWSRITQSTPTKRPRRGKNITTRLPIQIGDLCKGGVRRLTLPNGKALDLHIPKGHDPAKALRIEALGDAGIAGGAPGDVLVSLDVKHDEHFSLQGRDMHTNTVLQLPHLRHGGPHRMTTPSGSIAFQIPALSNPGLVLRLAGKGLPANCSGPAGDLYIVLQAAPSHNFTQSVEQFARTFCMARHG